MTPERFAQLSNPANTSPLTQEELDQGWHYCWDFDGLLVGPTMPEFQICNCPKKPTVLLNPEWIALEHKPHGVLLISQPNAFQPITTHPKDITPPHFIVNDDS